MTTWEQARRKAQRERRQWSVAISKEFDKSKITGRKRKGLGYGSLG